MTKSTDPNVSHWLAETDGLTPPTFSLHPDYSPYIQSAVRLTAEDLLVLVTEVPLRQHTGNVALNLANASPLYRIGSFTSNWITVKDFALHQFDVNRACGHACQAINANQTSRLQDPLG